MRFNEEANASASRGRRGEGWKAILENREKNPLTEATPLFVRGFCVEEERVLQFKRKN